MDCDGGVWCTFVREGFRFKLSAAPGGRLDIGLDH